MKARVFSISPVIFIAWLCAGSFVSANDLANPNDLHPHYDLTVQPPGVVHAPAWFVAMVESGTASGENRVRVGDRMVRTNKPPQAVVFEAFAPKVSVRWDEKHLFI